MATFLFVVALLNLSLGYALAIYLGHATPAWADAQAPVPAPAPAPAPVAVAPAAIPAPDTFIPQPEPTSEPPQPIVAELPEDELPPTETDSAPVEELAPTEAESESLADSLDEFKSQLDHYRDQLTQLDSRLRDCAENADEAAAELCLRDLKEANEQYAEKQSDALEQFEQLERNSEQDWVCVHVGTAIAEQTAEIQAINQQLDDVTLEEDLVAGLQDMLNQTSKLLQSNTRLQQSLEETERQVVTLPIGEMSADSLPQVINLVNSTDFQAAANQVWTSDPLRKQPITMAIIDVDHCREFNSAYGVAIADRVLQAVALVVGDALRPGDLATRQSGQKFVLMFPNTSARDATAIVERVRQTIGVARFLSGDGVLSISLSGALTQAVPDDTQESLLERVESTLQEAKRYGRNRTFLHEGQYAAPVVPPRFTIEPRSLQV